MCVQMLQWLLISLLVLAGANPFRICTCLHEDEPLVSAAGEEPHPDCDCPVIKPVQKLPANSTTVVVDAQFDHQPAAIEPTPVDTLAVDSASVSHRQLSSTPLYVTLRTLRN